MADAERVELAFLALWEWRDTILLFDGVDAVASTGQDLVRVALVANVPYDAVVGRVVEVMQDRGELDHAEASTKMPTRLADRFDQVSAQFIGDGTNFAGIEAAQVGGAVDLGQPRITDCIDHWTIVAPSR